MMRRTSMTALHAVFGWMLFLSSLVMQPALAASLKPATYRTLELAEKHLSTGAHAEALQLLEALLKRTTDGSLDRAMTWQLMGTVQADAQDYQAAVVSYQQALAQQVLEPGMERAVVANLAQLLVQQQDYKQGLELLETWLTAAGPDNRASADLSMLAANAAVELEDFERALKHAQAGFKLKDNPPETWHQMLVGLYYQTGKLEQATQLLKVTIERFAPNKHYWRQLVSLYLLQDREKLALTAMQLAWQQGLFDSRQDWFDLANLYASLGLPQEAARILEQGRQQSALQADEAYWQRLANYLLAARENQAALQALEVLFNEFGTAKQGLQLAQLYLSKEQWPDAARVLYRLAQSGTEAEHDEVYYLLGMARYELGEPEAAVNAFRQVSNHSRYREPAGQWLKFILSQQ
jgi:tetratricopeptide (TPR) repeat protein